MVKEDQERSAAGTLEAQSPSSHFGFRLAAVMVVGLSLSGTGFFMLHWLGGEAEPTVPASAPPARLFRLWPQDRQPDLVLILSGEGRGFLQPCGCSKPQYGGFERRFNFVQGLMKDRGWRMVAADLGDVAQGTGPQALLKYKFSMEAMKTIGYTGVSIGRNEMGLSLPDVMGEFALNNPKPRVLAANLIDRETNFPGMMRSWEIAGNGKQLKVALVGVVSEVIAKQVQDPTVRFEAPEKALPGVLKELEKVKPDVLVLLFQGDDREARACAQKFPQFQVVLCLSREEEPPSKPEQVGNTLVVQVGHKGRCLGTVGVFQTKNEDQRFELHYELVHLGEEYETPAGKDASNPILGQLEDYARAVKAGDYLARYVQFKTKHPVQVDPLYAKAEYVGSEKCRSCHKVAYKVWKESPHSHSYETLVKAQRPSLRQFDGECVACHVTGFAYETGFKDANSTPKLLDNGCENCHGPGSLHIKNKDDEKLQALMNPYRAPKDQAAQKSSQEGEALQAKEKRRILLIDRSCQTCHDSDNDVNWDFEKKWPKIIHREP
jgi:hypothetical protein